MGERRGVYRVLVDKPEGNPGVVNFATPAYVIGRCEKPFYEWTVADFSEPSEECSLVC